MLIQIKLFHTDIDRRREDSVLDWFIESHKVLVQSLLELRELVVATHARNQRLESADHIPIETHTHHLDNHLIEVLVDFLANYVAVPHWRESGYDPVYGRQVETEEIVLLYLVIDRSLDPTCLMLLVIILTNENPEASKKVRDHDDLDNESRYVLEELYLLRIQVGEELENEFFEIHEVGVEL